jgi:hypothetical protein
MKHYTKIWDDESVARLVACGGKDGLALYGAFWRVMEIVAAQMDSTNDQCSITYSVNRWSLLLSVRGSHLRHYLGHLNDSGLVTVEWTGSDIRVTIPKLLQLKDEYSKRSGHYPEQRTEQNIDKEKNKSSSSTPGSISTVEATSTDDPCVWVWAELEASCSNYIDQQARKTIAAGLRGSGHTLAQFTCYLRRRPLSKKWENPIAGLMHLAEEFHEAAQAFVWPACLECGDTGLTWRGPCSACEKTRKPPAKASHNVCPNCGSPRVLRPEYESQLSEHGIRALLNVEEDMLYMPCPGCSVNHRVQVGGNA